MGKPRTSAGVWLSILLASSVCAFAIDPSLDVSQYAHTAWTVRDGFPISNIYAMAQTSDGYVWFGTEFGLVRFDGVRTKPWQPPSGQQLPDRNITALLAARDGTLWIGTFDGLLSWNGTLLTRYPELNRQVVRSLIEDREGTVWVGGMAGPTVGVGGRLCAIRRGTAQCMAKVAPSAEPCGLCTVTAQAISGQGQTLDFGDGDPVLRGDIPHRLRVRLRDTALSAPLT